MLTEAQVAAREQARAKDAGMAYGGDPDGPRVRSIYDLLGTSEDVQAHPPRYETITYDLWALAEEAERDRATLRAMKERQAHQWHRRLWRWLQREGVRDAG